MISTLKPSNISDVTPVCKVMVFTIAHHSLALPMIAVQRVVLSPPLFNLNPQGVNLLHMGDRDIMVVDLYAHLSAVPATCHPDGVSQVQKRGEFMIIARSQQRNEIGILVDELPTVLDLPRAAIQPFPQNYRQTTPLGIARYIATLEQDHHQQVIFLLNM